MVVDTLKYHAAASHHKVYNVFGHSVAMDIPVSALILAAIGSLYLTKVVFSWITFLAETFMFSGMSLKAFGAKKGKWAVITGCTSGIGEQFAHQLARSGFNVVLVSRSQAGLDKVAQEIEAKVKGVQTKTVAVDLANAGPERDNALKKLDDVLNEMQVSVLVNNAGASHEMPVPFAESSMDEAETIIQVNNLGLLKLTRVVVPHLLASNKATRTQSLILNIGSLGGTIPSPYLAAYSASKAFLATFNDCLARELAPLGVVVQLVIPGFVVSKMSKIRRSSALVPNPAQFVKSALGSIGLARGAQGRANESTPWWTHALLDYVVSKTGALNLAVWYNGRMQKDIRRRALRKKAKSE